MDIFTTTGFGAAVVICAFIENINPEKYDSFTFKGFLVFCVVGLCYVIIKQQLNFEKTRLFYESKLDKIVEAKNDKLIEAQKQAKEDQREFKNDAEAREQLLINHITMSNEKLSGMSEGIESIYVEIKSFNKYFSDYVEKAGQMAFSAGLSRFSVPPREENKENKN